MTETKADGEPDAIAALGADLAATQARLEAMTETVQRIKRLVESAFKEASSAADRHEKAAGVFSEHYQYENGRRNMAQDLSRHINDVIAARKS